MAKNVTKEIYELGNGKYGYKIFVEGHLFIDQPHKPAVGGNELMTKEEANALADMVVAKMTDEPTESERQEIETLITKAGRDALMRGDFSKLSKEERERLEALSRKGNPALTVEEVISLKK